MGSVDVLLVEDNPGDARLAMEALKDCQANSNLHWVQDGVEAMAFLRRVGEYFEAPRPDVILLDLNLPKKDGRDVLADLKADENLRRIPVVVLTVSGAEEDIAKTYQMHANCYIQKPLDLEQFIEVVKSIQNFWVSVVELPSH
jgi:CheY-like chemotaxis protein